ncbi:MAG: pseudouridine synthase [Bacilli bacterium]
MLIRLQKLIADRGYCSRRKAEQYILDGKVKVDGIVVRELGNKFEDSKVTVEIDGTVLKPISNPKKYYFLVNKPCGFITSLSDDRGRKTVDKLIPPKYGRLFPVGRLDINTSGALIMTNDGDFANLVMHPSSSFNKTYTVEVSGRFTSLDKNRLERGIMLEDGLTSPAKVEILSVSTTYSKINITIHEGRNREVRRMMEALNHRVISLMRIKIGNMSVAKLKTGQYAQIPENIIESIRKKCLYNKEHNTYKKL